MTLSVGNVTVTVAEIRNIYRAYDKNFNKDRPMLLAAKCRPMMIVSKNIYKVYGDIRENGIPWEGRLLSNYHLGF